MMISVLSESGEGAISWILAARVDKVARAAG
jgi:hypothetical protein